MAEPVLRCIILETKKTFAKRPHHKLGKLYEMFMPPLDLAPYVRYDTKRFGFDNKLMKFLRAALKIDSPELIVSPRIFENAFVIREVSKLKTGARVLDFGCAESILDIQLASLGYKVTGIDIQDYTLKHPNMKFIKEDFMKVGFRTKFDCIVAVSSIEHMGLGFYGDPKIEDGDFKTIEKMKKILKPSGILVLTVPYGGQTSEWERSYDRDRLEKLLEGFTIKKEDLYSNVNGTWIRIKKVKSSPEKENVLCLVCRRK